MLTATKTRTDAHRLADLDPADYRLLAYEHVGLEDSDFEWALDEWHGLDLADRSDDDHFEALTAALVGEQYVCSLCGHSRSHTWAYFEHLPTGEVVMVGHICATKFRLDSREDVLAMLKDRAAGRKLATLRGQFLAGDPRARQAAEACSAAAVATAEWTEGNPVVNGFLADLGRKFERNAYLSTKQIEAAWWSAESDRQYAIRRDLAEQAEAERNANREPVPTTDERIEITGEIIKAEWKEYDGFDDRHVMTVRDDRGFLVWGTVPGSLGAIESGQRVRFIARVEPSKGSKGSDWTPDRDADPYFGFFKRPTKAEAI